MGQTKFIWIKNRRYYYYESYDTWEKALKQAKRHRKKISVDISSYKQKKGSGFQKISIGCI